MPPRPIAALRRWLLVASLCALSCSRAAARYVPSYVVPLGIIGGGSPYQRVMMQAYFGSASVGHYCTLDTGWGYITTPSDIICPVTQDPVYSPRNSSTAAAGQFATKTPWDASSPADTRPGCNKTQIPLAGGPPTPTCAFNHTYSGTWESGGVVTDQLRFVAGLSGFNIWQAVDIRAVFGATTNASELGPVCTFPWAICGANQGPASLLRQVVALAPAGVDPGLGLCVEAPSQWRGKPNGTDSFLSLGGGLPGGGELTFATSPLVPGGAANNTQQYGYWVGLRGVSTGGGGPSSSMALSNTTALVDSGTPWLALPPAAMQLYAARVQDGVAASTGLQMVKTKPPWVRGPSLQAVLSVMPSLTLKMEGNASVEVPASSFTTSLEEEGGTVLVAAGGLAESQVPGRAVLGLPLFVGRVTWLGNGNAVFSRQLNASGCAGLDFGIPEQGELAPAPSGAPGTPLTPAAALAAATAALLLTT